MVYDTLKWHTVIVQSGSGDDTIDGTLEAGPEETF